MKLRKNDLVMVIAGKDKGKKGRVMRIFPKVNKLLVEKINYRTVFLRKSQQNPKGGISQMEGRIDASNVQLVCPKTSKPTRLAYSILKDGTKHRLSKKSGEIL